MQANQFTSINEPSGWRKDDTTTYKRMPVIYNNQNLSTIQISSTYEQINKMCHNGSYSATKHSELFLQTSMNLKLTVFSKKNHTHILPKIAFIV